MYNERGRGDLKAIAWQSMHLFVGTKNMHGLGIVINHFKMFVTFTKYGENYKALCFSAE